jgi:hypothetical protein
MSTARTDEMRKAVASGDWQAAMRLWDAFAACIGEEIGRRKCTAARLSEAREFLDWAQRTVLCARAQSQYRLNAIQAANHVAVRYGAEAAHPTGSVRMRL